MIDHLWNKNEGYNPYYQINIQEEKQKFSVGPMASENTQLKKNSLNIKREAIYGQQVVNFSQEACSRRNKRRKFSNIY
jgi:hypothetical protein